MPLKNIAADLAKLKKKQVLLFWNKRALATEKLADLWYNLKRNISQYAEIQLVIFRYDTNAWMDVSNFGVLRFSTGYYAISTKGNISAELQIGKSENDIKNATEKTVGYHEVGHLIEILLCKNRYYYSERGVVSAYNSYEIASEIVNEALSTLPQGNRHNMNTKGYNNKKKVGQTKAQINAKHILQVSNFAATNRSEAFAECIADYWTNGKNAAPLSKKVWKITEARLKECGTTIN